MRRAKIVCTLGPATADREHVRALLAAGMDVARLNLSHGTHAEHQQTYALVREEADRAGRAVGVLVDLQGPKIRLGAFRSPPVALMAGAGFTITTRPVLGDATICSTTYAGLPGDVSPGATVLLDDGRLRLEVLDVSATDVSTRVVVGGELSNAKGINLPGVRVSAPAMSVKDVDDLRWALRLRADLVALSFVRCAEDIEAARRVMAEVGEHVPVLAKIEKPQAVENIAAILGSFDGLMVARGDLGVELPLEDVPVVQKELVELARRAAKPVIVATQMLESMIAAPRPTRAEASDVANAVLDGADAVMLSAETSVGRYPTEAAQTMGRIISSTEDHWLHRTAAIAWMPTSRGGVITKAAAEVAERIGAKYLVAFTQSGDSARRLSRYRSRVPILAFTPDPAVRSQLSVSWGVETFLVPAVRHTDEMVGQVDRALLEIGRCDVGDEVVLVAGSPPGIPGSTNAVRIHRMGDAINEVVAAYRGVGASSG